MHAAQQPIVRAIVNQKGGVGKTTTAINISAALARHGKKILLLDLDAQGNASTGLGLTTDKRDGSTYELFTNASIDFASLVCASSAENVFLIPASINLSGLDGELHKTPRKVFILKELLQKNNAFLQQYDYVLFDCPPSLGVLTVNALIAAQSVLVPLQAEFFALEGLSQLLHALQHLRQGHNPHIKISGIVLTMFEKRNRICQQVNEEVRQHLGNLVFNTVIPRSVRLAEAPSHGVSVLSYDGHSTGAVAYLNLAQEMLQRDYPSIQSENAPHEHASA